MSQGTSRSQRAQLDARHAKLRDQVRLAYGTSAHSVLLTSTLHGALLSSGLSAYDARGNPLPPLRRYPDARLMRLLDALLELHGSGHWLLDAEVSRPARTHRPPPRGLLPDRNDDPPPWA